MSGQDQPMTMAEVDALARRRYPSNVYAGTTEQVYALLLDVADAYVRHLEQAPAARIHPAPYIGGNTPLQAAVQGLERSLVDQREGRLRQTR